MGSGYQSFLNNKYWILRHGRSIPNENGLVVSSLENGVLEEYQLASHGVRQARLAGESFLKDLKENNIGLENVRICYSPFARTTHTAKEVASVLDIPFDGPQCKAILDIRERFFGPSYELKSHDKYPEIWALDEKDPFMQPEGGESVADVVTRLTKALAVMESEYKGCSVLIVSHGDPLQILQTIVSAAKEDESTHENDFISRLEAVKVHSVLSQHRKFALDTGELRQLMAENTCLDRKADISNRRRDKWSYSNSRAISHFLFSEVPSHIISTTQPEFVQKIVFQFRFFLPDVMQLAVKSRGPHQPYPRFHLQAMMGSSQNCWF